MYDLTKMFACDEVAKDLKSCLIKVFATGQGGTKRTCAV
jgi:hypothetical protein